MILQNTDKFSVGIPKIQNKRLEYGLMLLITVGFVLHVINNFASQYIFFDDGISYLAAAGNLEVFQQITAGALPPFNTWSPASNWQAFISPDQFLSFDRINSGLARTSVHSPLYFWLLHIWIWICGAICSSCLTFRCDGISRICWPSKRRMAFHTLGCAFMWSDAAFSNFACCGKVATYETNRTVQQHVIIDSALRGVVVPLILNLPTDTSVFVARQDYLIAYPEAWLPQVRNDPATYIAALRGEQATQDGMEQLLSLFDNEQIEARLTRVGLWEFDTYDLIAQSSDE